MRGPSLGCAIVDSVTQFLLGAAVTAAAAPPRHRRIALLLGGALGTLPDLDVFIDFGGAVENFTYHRGFSHSLFVLPWVGLALWGLLLWAWRAARPDRWRWLAAFQLALVTHVLLDAFTVYGTQLFWPLSTPPVSIGSIFIIDPAYTSPLLVGVAMAAILGAKPRAGFWLGVGLLLSQAYLAWTWVVQQQIRAAVVADMVDEGLPDAKVLVTPAPFTSLFWRIAVAYPSGDYAEGYWSLLDPKPSLRLLIHQGNPHLLAPLADTWPVERLRWFTHGFLAAEEVDGRIVAKDLRMGVEGAYVFRFAVGERRGGTIVPLEPVEQLPWPTRDWATIRAVWQRARDGQPSPRAEIGAPQAAPFPLAPPVDRFSPLIAPGAAPTPAPGDPGVDEASADAGVDAVAPTDPDSPREMEE
jgi:inner membrane protein